MTYADFAAQDLPILHQYWTPMMELPKVPALVSPLWGWGCLCGETTLTAVPGSPRSCHQSTSPSTGPKLLLLCTPPPFPQAPSYVIDLPLPRPSCSCFTTHSLVLSWGFDLPSPGCCAAALPHPQGCTSWFYPLLPGLHCCCSASHPLGSKLGLWPAKLELLLFCDRLQGPELTLVLTIPKAGYCCTLPSEPKPPLHPLNPGTIPLFPPHPQPESLWQIPRDPDQGSTRDLHMPTSQIPAPPSQQAYPEPRCYSSSNCTWSQDPRSAAALSISNP